MEQINEISKNYKIDTTNSVRLSSYTKTNPYTCPSIGFVRLSTTAAATTDTAVGAIGNSTTEYQFIFHFRGQTIVSNVFVPKGLKIFMVSMASSGAETPTFYPYIPV